jgi:hypothetical protein
MPYDTALTFGLLSLYVALKKEADTKVSLLCGTLAFLCFITYNGYWILAGFAMLCHVFAGGPKIAALMRRGVLIATGFVAPFLPVVFVSNLAEINFVAEYIRFANTVTQGDYAEGWSLPFEYLWHAEHFLIVILAALSFYAIFDFSRSRQTYPAWWLAGVIFAYACLTVFSVFTNSIVVLGRLVRQMMPFLILLSAYGLANLTTQKVYARYVSLIVLTMSAMQGIWNYGNSFTLSYPREFADRVQAYYQDFAFSPKRLLFGAPALCANNGYAMENAKYFLSDPETHPQVRGTVLLSESHPINFWPYQYEGYSPELRRQFRQRHLQMTFYKLADDADTKNIRNCFINE